jgi:serine/threonine protein kinase
LGATIWNLLVGRSPFSIPDGDNSSRALTARILHTSPPRTQRPDVPPALDLLLQQCLAKDPAHRPASALELARGLQRIETEAGYPRTLIAVETDLPDVPQVGAHSDDATALKPVTIASDSMARVAVQDSPSTGVASADAPAPPTPATGERWRVAWLLAGAASLLVVGLLLFVTAGGDGSGPSTTPTPTDSTPAPIDPLAPTQAPDVTGRRTAAGVAFRWSSPDGTQPGDSWQWRRTDTADEARTTHTSLTVTTDKRVCLQVRLIRGGFLSPWGNRCVD